MPGGPTVRLWRDALDRMGTAAADLPRLRAGLDKHLVRAEALHPAPSPLVALFALRVLSDGPVTVDRLRGAEAFAAVRRCSYRSRMVRGLGLEAGHFAQAAALAAAVPVFEVRRPDGVDTVDALADVVERAVCVPV